MPKIHIRFWGVRGSTPVSGEAYRQFGSHTSCVSIEVDGKQDLLILDAGSGMVALGGYVSQVGFKHAHVFLSHCHVDHIIGLPFFEPFWRPDFQLSFVSNRPYLRKFLEERVFQEPLFPVSLETALCRKEFLLIQPDESFTGDWFKARCLDLKHPGGSVGYRFDIGQGSVCYITDLEHDPAVLDQGLIDFVSGADLMVYDSSFTEEAFQKKRGWGHSTHIRAAEIARAAHIKQLALFHHAPENTDEVVAQQAHEAKAIFPNTVAAYEGLHLSIPS